MAEFKIVKARLSFPKLFKCDVVGSYAGSYSATLILDKKDPQVAKFRKYLDAAASETHGAAKGPKLVSKMLDENSKYICLKDGAKKTNEDLDVMDGYENSMYITCKTKIKPGVFDRDLTPLTEKSNKIYAGCYVNAIVSVYCGTHPTGGPYFTCNPLRFQFAADGEALGGISFATQEPTGFDDISDTGDDASDLY